MEALRHEAESYNQSHITESDLSKEIDLALFLLTAHSITLAGGPTEETIFSRKGQIEDE